MVEKKLKVVQMLPALDAGGVERGTLETAKYLVDKGHQSLVISAGGRMLDQLLAEGSTHYNWDVGAKRLGVIFWVRKVRKLLQQQQPDILHLRSRLPAWIGYLAWKKMDPLTRPCLVTTVHGPYTVSGYSAVMTRGETVIAISQMIRQYIVDNYPLVDSQQIQIIFRGVERKQYYPDYTPSLEWQQQWAQEFPAIQGKYLITLPARITRWKGQKDFLDIIDLLKQKGVPVHGVMVGEPHKRKQHFLQELHRHIQQRNLSREITFTGHRADLKNILSVSDVVLSLSLDPEAFGRTTIEALSLGVAVAGYNHGGVKEQLEAVFPQGAVPVGDVNAMAQLITQWHKNKVTVTKDHEFTLDNMLSKTLSVYRRLVANKAQKNHE